MVTIFETNVTAVGVEATDMMTEAGMFILFGEGAPSDLADFCFTIDNKKVTGTIQAGCDFVIDGVSYPVTAVGELVEKNLTNLGHITVNLDGEIEPSLPGTLHIQGRGDLILQKGSCIRIHAENG